MEDERKIQHDLNKLQKNHFEASQKNVTEANNTMARFQNWTLVLGIAELAFLGSFISQTQNHPEIFFAKTIVSILLLGILLFLMGSYLQYYYLLKTARDSYSKSNETISYIIEIKSVIVDEIPNHLRINTEKGISTDKWSNIFLFLGLTTEFIATCLIIVFLFRI